MDVRGNDISFIFQEPMTSLNPLHTIQKQMAESLALHQGLTGDAARDRIVELLTKVGIRDPQDRLDSYPHQLVRRAAPAGDDRHGAGQQAGHSDRGRTDNGLDVTIQAQILELLAELQKSENMGMLFITHDLGIVRRIADRVCVMKDGEIVETGPNAEIFDNPQHPYTRKLLAASHPATARSGAADAEEVARTDHLKVWFPIQRGFLKRTVGHVKAVNDATLSVRAGETLGIVGESGSGKTTLALAIMRLIASEGGITFRDQDVRRWSTRELRRLRKDMQIVFQDPFGSLSPRMTCQQIIAEGLGDPQGRPPPRPARVGGRGDDRGRSGPGGTMDRYPHEFSGGQRQRIAIARAMVLRPKSAGAGRADQRAGYDRAGADR